MNKKIILISVLFFFLVSTVSAADMQVEGLEAEDINASYTVDGVHFETSYLNKTLSPREVFVPSATDHAVVDWSFTRESWGESSGISTLNYQYGLASNHEYPSPATSALLGQNDSVDGLPANYFQYSDSFYSNESTERGTVFRSSFSEPVEGQGNEVLGNATWNITVESHYEHLIVKYDLIYNGSVQDSFQDIYSGEPPELLPVDGQMKTGFSEYGGASRLEVEYDNKYENNSTVNLTVAYPEDEKFLQHNFPVINKYKTDIYDSVVKKANSAGLNETLLDNTSGYKFRSYKVEIPADSSRLLRYKVSRGFEEEVNMRMWVTGSYSGVDGWDEGQTANYTFEGASETDSKYNVTLDSGEYAIELHGADGGDGDTTSGETGIGGTGGYINGTFLASEGDLLEIWVAQKGLTPPNEGSWGRFNGGLGEDSGGANSGGGGGSTEVLLNGSVLAIADGGGGGGAWWYDTIAGDSATGGGGGARCGDGGIGSNSSSSLNGSDSECDSSTTSQFYGGKGGDAVLHGEAEDGENGGFEAGSVLEAGTTIKGGANETSDSNGFVEITYLGTLNQPPSINTQDISWENIGGSESKSVKFGINDPDGDQISSHSSLPSGTAESEFTNSTLAGSDWSSPFDYFASVTDFNGAVSTGRELNFTVLTDSGLREDSGHTHAVDDQQIEYKINISNRGDTANYSLSFADEGTVVENGTVLEQEVASGSYVSSVEVWSGDWITGETEWTYERYEDSDYNHDEDTQQIHNRTELVADNSRSFAFGSVDISGTCSQTSSADVSSGNSVQITNDCNRPTFTGDFLSETTSSLREDTSKSHNLSNQYVEKDKTVSEDGGYSWSSVDIYSPTIAGTCTDCNTRTNSISASGSVTETYHAESDFITNEVVGEELSGQNKSKTSTLGTQYIYNQTNLSVNNTRTFQFTSVDITSQCSLTSNADIPSGTNQITSKCNNNTFNVDKISETNYSFKPVKDKVFFDKNYTGKRKIQLQEQTQNTNWENISTKGFTNPAQCNTANNTAVNLNAGATNNHTFGYECETADLAATSSSINDLSDPDRSLVWVNTTVDVYTDKTNNTEMRWNLSLEDKPGFDYRDTESYSTTVDNVKDEDNNGLSIIDNDTYAQVVINESFGSTLQSGTHDIAFSYEIVEEQGGGTGGTIVNENVKFNAETVEVKKYGSAKGNISIESSYDTSLTLQADAGQCSEFYLDNNRFEVEPGSSSEIFGVTPDSDRVVGETIDCNVTVQTSDGLPVTNVMLEAKVIEPDSLISRLSKNIENIVSSLYNLSEICVSSDLSETVESGCDKTLELPVPSPNGWIVLLSGMVAAFVLTRS